MKGKSKSNKKVALTLLLVVVISIGFAVMTSTIYLRANTYVSGNTWNVYFRDIQMISNPGRTGTVSKVDKTTIDFSTILTYPGDCFEFTVEVVNSGTIDAVISEIIRTDITEEQAEYLDYRITYSNGASIFRGDTLYSNTSTKLRVRVEYPEVETKTTTQNVDFEFGLKYEPRKPAYNKIPEEDLPDTSYEVRNDVVGEVCYNGTCTYEGAIVGTHMFYNNEYGIFEWLVLGEDESGALMLFLGDIDNDTFADNAYWLANGDFKDKYKSSLAIGKARVFDKKHKMYEEFKKYGYNVRLMTEEEIPAFERATKLLKEHLENLYEDRYGDYNTYMENALSEVRLNPFWVDAADKNGNVLTYGFNEGKAYKDALNDTADYRLVVHIPNRLRGQEV